MSETGLKLPEQTPETEVTEAQKSLREKTSSFFKSQDRAKVALLTGITIGSIGNAIVSHDPVGTVIDAGVLLGIVGALDFWRSRQPLPRSEDINKHE